MPGATSDPTPVFNNSGLNERARRLREMIAERQTRPSAYRSSTRVVRSNLLAKTPAIIEDSLTYKMSTNNEEFDGSGDVIMKHLHPRVICAPKKSFTDPQMNGNGEERTFGTSFIKTAERERHRNPKRYFACLTSTILAPIIGDNQTTSTKNLRRCASAKRNDCTKTTDYGNDICAIVVPSGSTLETPVIKLSGRQKSSTKVDECFGQSPEVIVEKCDLNRRPLKSATMKPASPGEKGHLEQYARVNKKPKTFSLFGDQKKSKSSSTEHLVTKEAPPKSTVFGDSLNDKTVHNDHSPVLQRSDDAKEINITSSLHSSKSLQSQQKKDYIVRIVEEDVLDMKEVKNDEDFSEMSASLRRPLITVTKASDSSSRDDDSLVTQMLNGRRLSMFGGRFVDRRKILPPSVHVKAFKGGTEETTLMRGDTSIVDVDKRTARQYRRSHTTSTCNGDGDGTSRTSPRRHLIGFLHRTSHLSLTSELSGDASFYLIG